MRETRLELKMMELSMMMRCQSRFDFHIPAAERM